MQVMIINLRPKKCSVQSRYGRYGSYATDSIQVAMTTLGHTHDQDLHQLYFPQSQLSTAA